MGFLQSSGAILWMIATSLSQNVSVGHFVNFSEHKTCTRKLHASVNFKCLTKWFTQKAPMCNVSVQHDMATICHNQQCTETENQYKKATEDRVLGRFPVQSYRVHLRHSPSHERDPFRCGRSAWRIHVAAFGLIIALQCLISGLPELCLRPPNQSGSISENPKTAYR